jgi:hypothetical protein
MATDIAIPEHLRKFLANSPVNSDADSMASASISVPRISLRGRKFRLIEGGEEIQKPAEELYCVILAVEPGPGLNQKTYYAKGYTSGDSSPPDCSSANGVQPDAWISNPVNTICKTCKFNQFKSAPNGKGKACKDSKRLWVVLPDAVEGTVFALGVPVSSLKAMAEYGAFLKANGIPTAAVITKLTMVDTEFPELQFEYMGVLEEATMNTALLRNEKKDWSMPSGILLEHQNTGPIAAPGAPVGSKLLESAQEAADTAKMSPDKATENW